MLLVFTENGRTSYPFYSTAKQVPSLRTLLVTLKTLPTWRNVTVRCKLQYIGETKRRLKDRFNEHRSPVDKTKIKSKPTFVSEHFLSHSDYSLTDIQLILLEQIHSSRDSIRKARGSHLIGTLDRTVTLEPNGLRPP